MEYVFFDGKAAIDTLPDVARLYVEQMSGWPYLIDTAIDYAASYRSVIKGDKTVLVVLARDAGKVVGATVGCRLPLIIRDAYEAIKGAGLDPDRTFWIMQMTVAESHKGKGISNGLSYAREDRLRESGLYDHIAFAAHVRPGKKPDGYWGPEDMWNKRGYFHIKSADKLVDKGKPGERIVQTWSKDIR